MIKSKTKILEGGLLEPTKAMRANILKYKKPGDYINAGFPEFNERNKERLKYIFVLYNIIVENISEKNVGVFLEHLIQPLLINSEMMIDKDFIHMCFKKIKGVSSIAFKNMDEELRREYTKDLKILTCMLTGLTEIELDALNPKKRIQALNSV